MTIRSMAALAAAFVVGLPLGARAEQAMLKYAFPAPPASLLNVWAMTPFAEDVNKASDGTLDLKLFFGPSLATFGNVYDRVTSGVIEVGFGMSGQFGGHSEFLKGRSRREAGRESEFAAAEAQKKFPIIWIFT